MTEYFVDVFNAYHAVEGLNVPTVPLGCEGVLVFRAHRPRGNEIAAFEALLVSHRDGQHRCPRLRREAWEDDALLVWCVANLLDVSLEEFGRNQRLASTQPNPPFPRRLMSESPYLGEGEWHWLARLPATVDPSHKRLLMWILHNRLRHLTHLFA